MTIVKFAQSFWLRSRKSLIIYYPARYFLWSHTFECFCAFEVRPEVTNVLVTRENILHQKSIYLQKCKSFIFKHKVKIFRNSCPRVKFGPNLIPTMNITLKSTEANVFLTNMDYMYTVYVLLYFSNLKLNSLLYLDIRKHYRSLTYFICFTSGKASDEKLSRSRPTK